MATPTSWWFLPILLVILQNNSAVLGGPPAPPSHPACYRTCDDKHCSVDIRCVWEQKPDLQIPVNYSLHWQSANSDEGDEESSRDGLIFREHSPRHEELRVWVQARNEYGSAKSERVVFNADDIIKPPPPEFSSSHHEPLEINWKSACDQLQLSVGTCDVQYRTEEDEAWILHESGLHGTYTFTDPKPWTLYQFQVRCSCNPGLMSEWSSTRRVRSAEFPPVGEVDVWRDCGVFPTNCYLTWKNPPASQARGLILRYGLRFLFRNGSEAQVNLSTAAPAGQFVYEEEKWRLTSSLKDVSSVAVSAWNSLGSTLPSSVPSASARPLTDNERSDPTVYLTMNDTNLSVSWDLPARSSDSLKEYVVQYKEVGRPAGLGFDWMKVNSSQTVGFTGQFQKYTPYQVSLFLVSPSGEVHHLKSLIGYSHQKAPSAVPSFKASSIEETEVTLHWEPVPLTRQYGPILYYQIGVNTQEVHNVTASSQDNQTWKLQRLHPGREYKVWLRAVNGAGPGPNVTARFTTKHGGHYGISVFFIVGGALFTAVLICFCPGAIKRYRLLPKFLFEKVPNPHNSRIFRHMKHQLNEPMACIHVPNQEPDPEISHLEVVENESLDPDEFAGAEEEEEEEESSPMDFQNNEMDDRELEDVGECGRKEYSQMVDSESSDGEEFTSGYETHFMPTALEILEV